MPHARLKPPNLLVKKEPNADAQQPSHAELPLQHLRLAVRKPVQRQHRNHAVEANRRTLSQMPDLKASTTVIKAHVKNIAQKHAAMVIAIIIRAHAKNIAQMHAAMATTAVIKARVMARCTRKTARAALSPRRMAHNAMMNSATIAVTAQICALQAHARASCIAEVGGVAMRSVSDIIAADHVAPLQVVHR
ncbi:MAG: hypothetical protein IPK32_05600 [Verrucomicrobiaceae bacterium]|nr:hypothetical protein [Verrucomicrobiaceae bacterium]